MIMIKIQIECCFENADTDIKVYYATYIITYNNIQSCCNIKERCAITQMKEFQKQNSIKPTAIVVTRGDERFIRTSSSPVGQWCFELTNFNRKSMVFRCHLISYELFHYAIVVTLSPYYGTPI